MTSGIVYFEEIVENIKDERIVNADMQKFSVPQFEKNKRWLLTNSNEIEKIEKFEAACSTQVEAAQNLFNQNVTASYPTIGDICDIGNGMVSGLDKVFQLNGQTLNEKEKVNTISSR